MLPTNWLECDLSEISALAPLQEISLRSLQEHKVRVLIKRDDLLHPKIGGNKIYKLHGFLRDHQQNASRLPLLSFGGAYSNHLYALAAAGQACGIETIGVVRGEPPKTLSPTLSDVKAMGMRLHFVSRQDYRQKTSEEFRVVLEEKFGEHYYIPEGGAGPQGAQGCAAIAEGINQRLKDMPSAVFHACGTGASLAGLAHGYGRLENNLCKPKNISEETCPQVIGVPVLKNLESLRQEVGELINTLGGCASTWTLLDDYHFGGYAKFPSNLRNFMRNFEKGVAVEPNHNAQLLLDPVYTSKAMYAVVDKIQRGEFAPGSTVVLVHSGGLQGRRGFDLDTD